jgi:hypothetical protein
LAPAAGIVILTTIGGAWQGFISTRNEPTGDMPAVLIGLPAGSGGCQFWRTTGIMPVRRHRDHRRRRGESARGIFGSARPPGDRPEIRDVAPAAKARGAAIGCPGFDSCHFS